ncbi:hypothetical protein [Marinilabilia sp.]|uniref:hypothetical protein n=1 Tax=Marinilabilia sp. TaxID=2021252 RepID=UPI0025BDDC6C|nr:hypothetical protein [Marinilabilia sp.]
MKNFNYLLITIFLFGQIFSTPAFAQDDDKESRIERLKSQKVAFLTERIGLSSDDAQKFWPVYNEMSAKMDELWSQKMDNINKLYLSDNELSTSEKEAEVDNYINFEVEKARLEKQYHEKFKKILTIDQVIKLYGAEHEFKKKMLRLIRKGKESSCEGCDELEQDKVAKT